MDVEDAIRTRRTHKAYEPEPVDRATVEALLELARFAPNHHLTEPWRFRVIGPETFDRLVAAGAPNEASKLGRAPTLVVASALLTGDDYQNREDLLATGVRRLHRPARRPLARSRLVLADAGAVRDRGGAGDPRASSRGRGVRRADPPRAAGDLAAGKGAEAAVAEYVEFLP